MIWFHGNLSAGFLALVLFSGYLSRGQGEEKELTSITEQFLDKEGRDTLDSYHRVWNSEEIFLKELLKDLAK